MNNKHVRDLGKDENLLESQECYRAMLGPRSCIYFVDEDIKELTVVDDEIFVIRAGLEPIKVYNSHTLEESRDIHISNMTSPRSCAGCAYNRALYFIDSGLERINKVDLTNNSVTRFKVTENYLPYGLSVTAEHRLLATVRISGLGGESRLVEYTSEGQQVREIKLEKSIEWAWHTVQLSSDQFIVSHGRFSPLHRVCVINAEGQIIKSFGKEKGEGEGQLCEPRELAIDHKNKHIYVIDFLNNRVLIFDINLNCLGQIHSPSGLSELRGLHFDASADELCLAATRPDAIFYFKNDDEGNKFEDEDVLNSISLLFGDLE